MTITSIHPRRRGAIAPPSVETTTKALILARMLETMDQSSLPCDVRDSLAEFQTLPAKMHEEAAFLIAALLDPSTGIGKAALREPLRSAVTELKGMLQKSGHLAPYTLSGGRVGIWGDL